MTERLVRDVMIIGVPICRAAESCGTVAARLWAEGERGAVVVAMDDEGRAVGWAAREAVAAAPPGAAMSAVLQDAIPEVQPDMLVVAAAQLLQEQQAEYGFLMHAWPGLARPAAFVSRRDLEHS
jgi:hypothetical protein